MWSAKGWFRAAIALLVVAAILSITSGTAQTTQSNTQCSGSPPTCVTHTTTSTVVYPTAGVAVISVALAVYCFLRWDRLEKSTQRT